jgi:ATP phosphoribosyltransferase
MIVSAVMNSDTLSFGLIGSDYIDETGYNVSTETALPIVRLRFALATSETKKDRTIAKIKSGEPLTIGTSYPNTAIREMANIGLVGLFGPRSIQPGGIESLPQEYSEIDAIFELVRSGNSIRNNELVILQDNIKSVDLMLVTKAEQ